MTLKTLVIGVRTSAIALCVLAASCSPTEHSVVLRELRSELHDQFHECVPLGWSVEPAHGVALPGVSVEVNEYGEGRVWLAAMWLAHIRPRDHRRADVRTVERLMDALTKAQLLRREDGAFGKFYHLTAAALPYFFTENRRDDDPDGLSYLCYSSVVPDAVVWTQPIHSVPSGNGIEESFQAEFTWHPGPVASWAQDPFIRAHSVILAPNRTPAIAEFVHQKGAWVVTRLYPQKTREPLVVDASAWPAQ